MALNQNQLILQSKYILLTKVFHIKKNIISDKRTIFFCNYLYLSSIKHKSEIITRSIGTAFVFCAIITLTNQGPLLIV